MLKTLLCHVRALVRLLKDMFLEADYRRVMVLFYVIFLNLKSIFLDFPIAQKGRGL